MNRGWQLAPVKAIKHETGDVKTFMLEPGMGFALSLVNTSTCA